MLVVAQHVEFQLDYLASRIAQIRSERQSKLKMILLEISNVRKDQEQDFLRGLRDCSRGEISTRLLVHNAIKE